MTLPAAAQYTGAFAGRFAGFSVPGIEVYEHDQATGAPCEPCEVDVGDVCRPRWVNRQDHGYLTRANIARAGHPNAPYCCPDTGYQCDEPYLRTTAYGLVDGRLPSDMPISGGSAAQNLPLSERRALVKQIRDSARARQQAIAGAVAEVRSRRMWGNHQNHNNHIAVSETQGQEPDPVGIRYIPMSGASGPLSEDALIVAPGHHSRR